VDTLRDKVAVITGAASGIGRAVACALADRGAHIVAIDLDDDGVRALADELSDGGATVFPQRADVSNPGAFDGIRSAALQRFDRVDIVVNNVGVLTNGLPEDIPVTEWQRILDINLLSVVRSNAAFLPLLLDQGSGHLVNTASFAGLFTYSYDRLPYAATKAAIVQISEGLAIYLRPKNIGVTLLVPGPVLTNIAAAVPTFGGGAPLRIPGEQFELLDPAPVGELVADAILRNRFFVPTHPHVVEELRRRVDDWDAYIDYQISREPCNERQKPMADTRTQGLDVLKQMVPGIPDDVTGLRDGGVADELGDLSLDHVFGALWTRPGLDRRSRSLVTLGALIALRASDELKIHFQIALNNGLTLEEIEEVIYHMTGYAGYPAAVSARRLANEVLRRS
jgi:NAD(P)-dependent dehydrogenase (short-subunit alcohol dehydrogenase family)/alkylhydroperoxidase/carboxymuconolactone decarboxylase family protein YurZ